MKSSKTLLLLTLVTVLIIAVSACAVIPSQTNEAGNTGKTVTATVKEINGNRLTISMQADKIYTPVYSGMSYATFNGNFNDIFSYNYSYITMSAQVPGNPSYSYNFDFSGMAIITNVSFQYASPTTTLKTVTVIPEMLVGISVGDIVDVTFDANDNVLKIEKRTAISSTADQYGGTEADADKVPDKKENEK
jgi:hypothetical protein